MSSVSANNPVIVRYGKWRNQFIIALVALALAVFFWYKGKEYSLGFWVSIAFLSVVTVLCVLPSDTKFDPDRRDVERRWSLFGVFPIFRRRLSLDLFCRICLRHLPEVEPGDGHTWMVGLERNSGRPVYVSYFNVFQDGACQEAQQFALELSKLTGLPLSDKIRVG